MLLLSGGRGGEGATTKPAPRRDGRQETEKIVCAIEYL